MMYYYNGFPFHMWGFGPIIGPFLMLAFLVLAIYAIMLLTRSGSRREDTNRALDILKERYAKGEITKEQFESMKKDLK